MEGMKSESVSGQVRDKRTEDGEKTKQKHKRTGKFQNLSGEVLQNSRTINGGLRSDPHVVLRALLQVSVDTTDRELQQREEGKRINVVPPPPRHQKEKDQKLGS